MGSYAENEQDAREYAEWQREFAEEKLEEARFNATLLDEEKIVITMDEIMEHRYMERREQLLAEINEIVGKNILYGQPPYIRHHQPAEEILLDIINDLGGMKERLGLESGNL